MLTDLKLSDDYTPPDSAAALFFDNVMTALNAAAPEGSSVRLFGFDSADEFLRAGYRVTDGDCDVCIARGGQNEFAFARRAEYKKLILLPTQEHYSAACSAYRTEVKAFAKVSPCAPPFAVVFDEAHMHQNLAALFGEIVSLDIAAFDAEFALRMDGRRPDGSAASDIARLITELTDELSLLEKNRKKQKTALLAAERRAAEIVAKAPYLLHASGAAQAAEAYRMLCSAEGRQVGMRGETEMIMGGYVTDFYIKSLTVRKSDFPPDNNRRIDGVCSYFGADVRRACMSVAPIFSPQKLRLYEYRVNEFRAEQLRMLADIKKRRLSAWQVFKRLYPDDGYCLATLVDKTDIPLCVALAPDIFQANSLLSFLKQAGRLEKYIV